MREKPAASARASATEVELFLDDEVVHLHTTRAGRPRHHARLPWVARHKQHHVQPKEWVGRRRNHRRQTPETGGRRHHALFDATAPGVLRAVVVDDEAVATHAAARHGEG